MTAVFFRQLLQPDIRALGDEHNGRHPGLVGAEGFILVQWRLIALSVAATPDAIGPGDKFRFKTDELVADEAFAATPRLPMTMVVRTGGMKPHPDGQLFFTKDIDCEQDSAQIVAQVLCPVLANEVQLPGK